MIGSKHSQFSILNSQLKKGYKQTVVGLIPEDWKRYKLGKVAEIRMCKRIFAEQTTRSGDISFFKIGTFGKEPDAYISYALYNEFRSKYSFPEKGDILLSAAGTLGKTVVYNGQPAYFQDSNIVWLEIDHKKLSNEYLHHCYQVIKWASPEGSTISRLYNSIIRDTNIVLPSTLKEQITIATALSDVDDLIESLEKLIAKKRAIKTGAMQQLLTGKKRLRGFDGEWGLINIGKDASLNARIGWQALTTAEYLETGSFFLVTGTDFVGGHVNWNTCHFVDKWRYSQDRKIQLRLGDVLVTKDGSIGKVGYVDGLPMPTTLNSGVFVVRPMNNIFDPRYLFYVLNSKIFDDFLSQITAGSTITHLYQKDFVTFEFNAPEHKEQQFIATVLSEMDAEIQALEKRLDKTKSIKQGMMQELLTGKTRLIQPVSIKSAGEAEKKKSHNWQINEAVVISVLAKYFGSTEYPLGRKRYTKLSYLLHRHEERIAEGYLKKAAGPYNPATKYSGPEKIAQKNGYIKRHKRDNFAGFIVADNIAQAEEYFEDWYGKDALTWLNQFRKRRNDDLELLTTVDMAMEDLQRSKKSVSLSTVKELIDSEPEWKPKLSRDVFSDFNIARAMKELAELFG
ncbi:MAG: restriction endonuclease subunit S [Kiritimatiellae bacterium]|jgi:type I restriction enzyme S subunit|nr:restriction endonuclease subunit S [Kiritimatiellia bacterium]